MKKLFFLFLIFIIVFFVVSLKTIAVSDDIQANLEVDSPCGNGICDTILGENMINCPGDCFCNNNGICETAKGENENNCPNDCGCNNNGICESARGETADNCSSDCAVVVPPTPRPPSVRRDIVPPRIFNLLIKEITLNSAVVSWETDELALCQLFWGRTSEYRQEVISEESLYFKHSTGMTGLIPSTIYHFKIVCQDNQKNESETGNQKFITLALPDTVPPTNVSNFEATPDDRQITLVWENPPDPDFKAVKIMRSEEFYPSNPQEGTLVYDDKGTSFVDIELTNGIKYYYTAFAYDRSGNYASGAIVSAIPWEEGVPPVKIFGCTDPSALNYNPKATIDDGSCEFPPPPPEIEKLTLKDFDFIQGGEKIPLIEEKIIKVKSEKSLTVSIDYEKIPEVLKTIMVTLEKDGKFFSFLLRINPDKTAYEAVIFPPEPGVYPLTITVLDYKNQTLKKIIGELRIEGLEISPKIPWYKKWWKLEGVIYLLIILIILVFLIIIVCLLKKNREKEAIEL